MFDDGFDDDMCCADYLFQIDAHMIFSMGKQPSDRFISNPWHKRNILLDEAEVNESAETNQLNYEELLTRGLLKKNLLKKAN